MVGPTRNSDPVCKRNILVNSEKVYMQFHIILEGSYMILHARLLLVGSPKRDGDSLMAEARV
jgi:hypothetical protein